MDFSSSPLGFSTPRVRLEPKVDEKVKKRDIPFVKSSSAPDFSFETSSDNETSRFRTVTSVIDDGRNVKRKNANGNLRSPILANKRTRVEEERYV